MQTQGERFDRYAMTHRLVLAQGELHVPAQRVSPIGRHQRQSVVAVGGMSMIEHVYHAVLKRHIALKTPRLDASRASAQRRPGT